MILVTIGKWHASDTFKRAQKLFPVQKTKRRLVKNAQHEPEDVVERKVGETRALGQDDLKAPHLKRFTPDGHGP